MNQLFKLGLTLVLGFSILTSPVVGDVRHVRTRHDPSAILSATALNDWGGVAFQAEATFADASLKGIDVRSLTMERYDRPSSSLIIRFGETDYAFKINEDHLDRLISWIDNKGRGLYTYHAITPTRVNELGLSPDDKGGYVATEFADSKELCDLVFYLDFFEHSLVKAPKDLSTLLGKHNTGVKRQRNAIDGDYIVSDLDSTFTVILKDGQVVPNGTIFAYHREESRNKDRVYVHDIEEFRDATVEQLVTCMENRYGKVLPWRRLYREAAVKHSDAINLARTIAMLRTIHSNNRPGWDAFTAKYFTSTHNHD